MSTIFWLRLIQLWDPFHAYEDNSASWVMDYAHWWPWTCEVLEHSFFYLLLMLLMAVIKPCETSMPKQQLGGCDNLMAGLDVSHGFMPVMILVFYYLFEVCCYLCFLSSKFKVKWKGNLIWGKSIELTLILSTSYTCFHRSASIYLSSIHPSTTGSFLHHELPLLMFPMIWDGCYCSASSCSYMLFIPC